MRTGSVVAMIVTAAMTASASEHIGPQVETMNAPSFGTVTVYLPVGETQQVVLFLSGDGGWNLGVIGMAERLRRAGALVVGIDIRAFVRSLEASRNCAYPAGALEELSRAVQLRFRLRRYHRPILVGYSSGATMVYAAIAAAPSETFAGAISLGFCPSVELATSLCALRGLKATKQEKGTGYGLAPFKKSTVPWMVLQGETDQVCAPNTTRAFVAATGAARLFSLPRVGHGFGVTPNWEPQFVQAYQAIAAARRSVDPSPVTTPEVADLSLVEVPTTNRSDPETFAILLTGDGGWADLDRSLAAGLSAHGVPVVGWSSLGYYWTPRSPDGAAADLKRIIEHYAARWGRSRVLIIGYSFGADVAPFLVNRLPESVRARVTAVTLLGPSATASFEFHLTNWLAGGSDPRYPVRLEVERSVAPVTCVSGADEADSVCHDIKAAHVQLASVGRGHHFSGEYGQLLDLILRQITPASAKDHPVAADAPLSAPARSDQGESGAGSGGGPARAALRPSSGRIRR